MKKLTPALIAIIVLIYGSVLWAQYGPDVLGEESIIMPSGTTIYSLNAVGCLGGTVNAYTTGTTDVVSALISVSGVSTNTNIIRWKGNVTYNATTKVASNGPTSKSGFQLYGGDYIVLDSKDQINKFGATLDSDSSGVTLHVLYYGKED